MPKNDAHAWLQDQGRVGEICAQLIVLLAVDEGNSGTKSINAVLARRGKLVSTFLNSLFTKRIRRALMSAVQLPFAEFIKVEFAEEDPTRAPPVVSLVRPGRTEGARKAYTRLADGKTNVLQFIETTMYSRRSRTLNCWSGSAAVQQCFVGLAKATLTSLFRSCCHGPPER